MRFVECELVSDYKLAVASRLFIDLHQIQAVVIGMDHGVIQTATRDRYWKIALKDAKRIAQELQIIQSTISERSGG